uniref:RRM domain-containing protein n=1 Tax=Monodon monoceros TaxID=40151 RepID=A0A8C6BMA7_MONMO
RNVCFSDHLRGRLVGNVYVKFWHEEDAAQGVAELNNHWFNSQTVHAKLSPVTDFWEPCCRQMGEAAPLHVGSSQTGARTHVPCIGRRTPNHCATREAPKVAF